MQGLTYRVLTAVDYEAVQNLFTKRSTWMGMDGVSPIAGTWSLRNFWLNPEKPEWCLKGAFFDDTLVCTHGTYWSSDLPYAYNSKLLSIETPQPAKLPPAFLHFYDEMMNDVVRRGYLGFLSLVTPRLNKIYNRVLPLKSSVGHTFTTRVSRHIPANQFTGIEHIDFHLLNLTPAPFDTLVRETLLCTQ